MAIKIRIDELAKTITKELSLYSDDINERADSVTYKETNKARSRVKRAIDSSGIKGQGDYKKSISSKLDRNRIATVGIVYAKAPHYRLTHLLENGHVIKNASGTYGRTKSFKHWSVAQDETEKSYQDAMADELEKG